MSNEINIFSEKMDEFIKLSGIPKRFFEIQDEMKYPRKIIAKYNKIRKHYKRKNYVQLDIFIRDQNKKYQRNNNGKLIWDKKSRKNKLMVNIAKTVLSVDENFKPTPIALDLIPITPLNEICKEFTYISDFNANKIIDDKIRIIH